MKATNERPPLTPGQVAWTHYALAGFALVLLMAASFTGSIGHETVAWWLLGGAGIFGLADLVFMHWPVRRL